MMFRRKTTTITPADAERAAAAGSLQLVDVRDAEEVAGERVPHARHIPLVDLKQRVDELDASRPVAFICRSGMRSGMAVKIARSRGLDAFNVAGGVIAWRKQSGATR
jgi:rhodanese-related sulfurtransferase